MKTQAEIRAAFWRDHPEHDTRARQRGTRSKSQNQQTTDCRMAFCDYVENLSRNGSISESLAHRVTL